MEIKSIKEELNSLAYHGRGIMIGKSADGTIVKLIKIVQI